MFTALAAGVLVGNVCLKNLIARPRPCWLESVPLLIGNPTDYSFPSGHTLSSVIGAFMLTAANRRFGILAIPLAALIGFSRLYLYVHFPSDVLASVVIGTLIGGITVRAVKKAKALSPNTAKSCKVVQTGKRDCRKSFVCRAGMQ